MAAQIAQNLALLRERIERAAERSGRPANSISLLAVSKTAAPRAILEAAQAGICDFGENYVQEALSKQTDSLLASMPGRWHFIGHLQRNKAKDAVGRFALIQSVDSLALGNELNRRAGIAGVVTDVLLEVKLDPGSAKFGIDPIEALELAAQVDELPALRCSGLMGMAPFTEAAEGSRPAFRSLRELYDRMKPSMRRTISMGMSRDFEVAIEEGATMVRIGTALFGSR